MEIVLELYVVDDTDDDHQARLLHAEVLELDVRRRRTGVLVVDGGQLHVPTDRPGHAVNCQVTNELSGDRPACRQLGPEALELARYEHGAGKRVGFQRVT